MARLSDRILLIADTTRQVQAALGQSMPAAQVVAVPTYFDAIAELEGSEFSCILASAEPIERRPEAAIRTLRHVSPESRLVLFGHPTLEPLSRKMLEFGCDDYVISPPTPADLSEVLNAPRMRIVPPPAGGEVVNTEERQPAQSQMLLENLALAEIFLSAQVEHPQSAFTDALAKLNARLKPRMELVYLKREMAAPASNEGKTVLSAPVRGDEPGWLHLVLPADEDQTQARGFLSRLAEQMGRLAALQARHARLQMLAITDDLTGLYNGRYFKQCLSRLLDKARERLFPVTLFIFDIDDFKKYNDQYGHGVGDEILRQTGTLIKRCCREHDFVARLGGDEFAAVFWENEAPRQPKDPKQPPGPRAGQTPEVIFNRFRKQLATQQFSGLGHHGKGMLTISAGMAVFPYQANSMEDLVRKADEALMFGAKRSGKNSIFLVGGVEQRPAVE